MPLILGQRLGAEMSHSMRTALMEPGQFRTQWGLATESVTSALYDPHGYWRGPIWAPSTMILIDGLSCAGFRDDAMRLADDYQRLCVQGGFPENHHAETGQPLRDPTYTWTSSVYLALLDPPANRQ
jgi:glycogen debranching enzyme